MSPAIQRWCASRSRRSGGESLARSRVARASARRAPTSSRRQAARSDEPNATLALAVSRSAAAKARRASPRRPRPSATCPARRNESEGEAPPMVCRRGRASAAAARSRSPAVSCTIAGAVRRRLSASWASEGNGLGMTRVRRRCVICTARKIPPATVTTAPRLDAHIIHLGVAIMRPSRPGGRRAGGPWGSDGGGAGDSGGESGEDGVGVSLFTGIRMRKTAQCAAACGVAARVAGHLLVLSIPDTESLRCRRPTPDRPRAHTGMRCSAPCTA
jgi:hypothetical protein